MEQPVGYRAMGITFDEKRNEFSVKPVVHDREIRFDEYGVSERAKCIHDDDLRHKEPAPFEACSCGYYLLSKPRLPYASPKNVLSVNVDQQVRWFEEQPDPTEWAPMKWDCNEPLKLRPYVRRDLKVNFIYAIIVFECYMYGKIIEHESPYRSGKNTMFYWRAEYFQPIHGYISRAAVYRSVTAAVNGIENSWLIVDKARWIISDRMNIPITVRNIRSMHESF